MTPRVTMMMMTFRPADPTPNVLATIRRDFRVASTNVDRGNDHRMPAAAHGTRGVFQLMIKPAMFIQTN
jgi:hypothetical protein